MTAVHESDHVTLHTIGHSTRTLDELAALLSDHDIEQLIDVRTFPASRRLPQFNKQSLEQTMPARGIEYAHMPELGGRRKLDRDAPDSAGGAWRHTSFRAYAQYAQSAAYADALDELLDIAGHARVAIMCSEAVPWRCHRWLVSDTAAARGAHVWHIIGDGDPRGHLISSFAHVDEHGHVTWPGPPSNAPLKLAQANRLTR